MERSLSDLSSSEWLERAPFYYTKSKNRKEGEQQVESFGSCCLGASFSSNPPSISSIRFGRRVRATD
jgi:hypothetical protein